MAQCTAYSKKAFLSAIDKLLDEDDLVFVSTFVSKRNMAGKKPNISKEVTVGFPADAFINDTGVGDLNRENTTILSAIIGKESMFTADTMDIVDYQDKFHKVKKGRSS